MTREEFIRISFIGVLDRKECNHYIEGDRIVVVSGNKWDNDVSLNEISNIPPNVTFNNKGDVSLIFVSSIPPGVIFNNGLNVFLRNVTNIHPEAEFNNGGNVSLSSLKINYVSEFKANIKGINCKTLLNGMIKRSIFFRD